MSTDAAIIDLLVQKLGNLGEERVATRKMFGEYCLYVDAKPVALICDNTLYVKVTAAGQELWPQLLLAPPYPGAKPHLQLFPELWDDSACLCELLEVTSEHVTAPKPRKKKGE